MIPGARDARLRAFLKRRERWSAARRKVGDESTRRALFRRGAVVFTDTADFTAITARYGILHFLMMFDRGVRLLGPAIERHQGRIVKAEGDSLILRFPDVASACAGVRAAHARLQRANRARSRSEALRFSFGVGYGDLLDVDGDVFGLEVNLASKLGEDFGRAGQCLLTPAAAEALPREHRGRLAPLHSVAFGDRSFPVYSYRLTR